MTNVSRTNRNGKRPKSDHYPTRPAATRAFVRFERQALRRASNGDARWGGKIWEPAAGEGWLAEVLRQEGFDTLETDLYIHPRTKMAYRTPCLQRDFFGFTATQANIIVTNPPYSEGHSGDRFVRHALRLRPRYVAMFLPITFLAGLKRYDLIEGSIGGLRLARVLVLAWRCTLKPSRLKLKNSGVVTYAWFVWERGFKGQFTVHRLYRSPDEQARYTTGARKWGADLDTAEASFTEDFIDFLKSKTSPGRLPRPRARRAA